MKFLFVSIFFISFAPHLAEQMNPVFMFGPLKIRKSYSKTDRQADRQILKLTSAFSAFSNRESLQQRLAYWVNPIRV
jgi:hypothetical protein